MTVHNSARETRTTTCHLLRSRSDVAALQPVWERLAAHQARDGLCRSFPWNVEWLRHVAPHATPHVLVINDSGGEVVGIVSLCETVFHDRSFSLPALGFIGREVTSGDFLDVLAAPGCEEAVADHLIAHLEAQLGRVPLLVLGEILEGSVTAKRVAAWIEAKGLNARRQEERSCRYIELPETFAAYEKALSRNMRSNLRRRTRQLLEDRGCEILRLRGAAEVLPRLDDFVRLHEARWTSIGQTGTFVRPGLKEFVAALAKKVDTELYMLMDAGEAVAALLFFRHGEASYYYQGGWNPASECARLSPNLVLFGRSIADAIEDGYRWYEFMQGDESYKTRFTTSERKTSTLLIPGRGLKVRAYLAALRLHDWWKARKAEQSED